MTTGDGVSTYLALIFGTLLSSQGTVASFVLTLSGFPPGFPSVFPTLSDPFGPDSLSAGPFDIHYFSSFSRRLIIESCEFEFRHADAPKSTPSRVCS
ncbi:hypothetical protein BFF78_32445 [Streptomyces fodineus]|uniref:Uncharacterized protein n=1 Tax=Streptomyces fodineus TaxID=1904616 RepID=A0A1D7YHS4_9ACTN|nr:hypothetical protein BFF78_32445 [Streptomyces fodineus]